MLSIELISKRLELKYNWSISRNTSTYKENFYVEIIQNNQKFYGEVAPNVRYGETPLS